MSHTMDFSFGQYILVERRQNFIVELVPSGDNDPLKKLPKNKQPRGSRLQPAHFMPLPNSNHDDASTACSHGVLFWLRDPGDYHRPCGSLVIRVP